MRGALFAVMALGLAAMGGEGPGPLEGDRNVDTRTSQSRGPGNDYRGSWNWHPPLPKPASQAKRRRKARRSRS